MSEQKLEFFANNNHTGWEHKPQIVEIGSLPETSDNGDDKFNKKIYIIKNSFPDKVDGKDIMNKICVEVGYLKDSEYESSKYFGSLQNLESVKDILKKPCSLNVTAYNNQDEGGNDYLAFKSSDKKSQTSTVQKEVEQIEKILNNENDKF